MHITVHLARKKLQNKFILFYQQLCLLFRIEIVHTIAMSLLLLNLKIISYFRINISIFCMFAPKIYISLLLFFYAQGHLYSPN